MKQGLKNASASLIAILAGLIAGFAILLVTKPETAFQGLIIILRGGFNNGMKGLGQVLYGLAALMVALMGGEMWYDVYKMTGFLALLTGGPVVLFQIGERLGRRWPGRGGGWASCRLAPSIISRGRWRCRPIWMARWRWSPLAAPRPSALPA